MAIQAGELRFPVTVKRQSTDVDGAGQELDTWTEVVQLKARIDPIEGKELLRGTGDFAEVTHKIKTRFFPGIVPKMRLYFGSRIFDIKRATNVGERGAELEILAVELV
jgi:SPP1 family predicted phage head-tail adaptor